MDTVIFKKFPENLFAHDFRSYYSGRLLTDLFFLAIARQSWVIPKRIVSNWTDNWFEPLTKRGVIEIQGDSIQITPEFHFWGRIVISNGLREDQKICAYSDMIDGKETFKVYDFTVQIAEVKEHVIDYLEKEKRTA